MDTKGLSLELCSICIPAVYWLHLLQLPKLYIGTMQAGISATPDAVADIVCSRYGSERPEVSLFPVNYLISCWTDAVKVLP